jgi:hypothetical protein
VGDDVLASSPIPGQARESDLYHGAHCARCPNLTYCLRFAKKYAADTKCDTSLVAFVAYPSNSSGHGAHMPQPLHRKLEITQFVRSSADVHVAVQKQHDRSRVPLVVRTSVFRINYLV